MYDMFCTSLKNLIHSLSTPDGTMNARLDLARSLSLLTDVSLYHDEAAIQSEWYQMVSDCLIFLKENQNDYPTTGAFLWTLESRGMMGARYGRAEPAQLEALAKMIVMLLKMQYWDISSSPGEGTRKDL